MFHPKNIKANVFYKYFRGYIHDNKIAAQKMDQDKID